MARDFTGNRARQIGGGADRLPPAPFDDTSGQTAAVWFFSVPVEKFGQLLFAEACDEIGRRFTLRDVEAQIKRAVGCKTEASRMIGQLVGRQTEVEQNAVDRLDLQSGQHVWELGITGFVEVTITSREVVSRFFQHQGVAVKTD